MSLSSLEICIMWNLNYFLGLWRENLSPLMSFLEATSQGVGGQVTNMKGEPLPDVKILVNNHPLHVIRPGKFLAFLPPGMPFSFFWFAN